MALSAVGSSHLQEEVAGVACLATPFISARLRDIGQNPWETVSAAVLVLLLVLFWLSDMLVPDDWGGLARFGFAALVGSLLMGVFGLLVKAAREHAKKLCRELTPLPPKRDQLLIIRSPADEASGAFAFFQFICQVTVRLFLLTQSWYAGFKRLVDNWVDHKLKIFLVGVGAFVLLIAFLFGYAALSTSGASSWLRSAALIGSGASFFVLAAAVYLIVPFLGAAGVTLPFRLVTSALLWPVVVVMSILLLVPFGWQAAVANLFLDVTAEPTPVGSWETHLVEPPTSEELGVPVPPLMHIVYENPYALRKLGEWINERGS